MPLSNLFHIRLHLLDISVSQSRSGFSQTLRDYQMYSHEALKRKIFGLLATSKVRRSKRLKMEPHRKQKTGQTLTNVSNKFILCFSLKYRARVFAEKYSVEYPSYFADTPNRNSEGSKLPTEKIREEKRELAKPGSPNFLTLILDDQQLFEPHNQRKQ